MLKALRSLLLLLAVAPAIGAGGQAAASRAESAPAIATRILVQFDARASTSARDAALARVDVSPLTEIRSLGVTVAAVPASRAQTAIAGLEASPVVVYAELDGTVRASAVKADDPYLGEGFWQLANPGFPEAWTLTTGGAGTVIAVLDTGVDRGHEDLGALAAGYDFVNADSDPSDDNGHGTAVSGIIAAQGGNSTGVAGICWSCKIMPVKVLGADVSGSWSDVAAGITWAADHGAKVINMSFGLPSGSQAVAAAVEYAQAQQVVLVASAGNGNSSARFYPAVYPGVVSVGAVDEAGLRYSISNGNVGSGAWGSNYGSWVDVDAPGCVNSTWPASSYAYFCGTSAAAPFVSGLAGLALSYVPSASANEVVQAIEQAAKPTAGGGSAHGLIDAPGALGALASAIPGSVISFVPRVAPGSPLKVRFINTSTKRGPYRWSFGDGTSSTKVSPRHTYKRAGSYTVTLAAIDGGTSATMRMTVGKKGQPIFTRLTRKIFKRSQAQSVKLVYRLSSPNAGFGYRLERKSGAGWRKVRGVEKAGAPRSSSSLTVKQLFGNVRVTAGSYRLLLHSGSSQARVTFVAK